MTRRLLTFVFGLLAASALIIVACGDDDGGGAIEVLDAEFRTTPNSLGAGYLTISNGTAEAITLVGASSPDVDHIELHESTMNDDGVMQMIQRPDGFLVEPGEQVSLEPGGKHLMLFDPEVAGDELDITLDFGTEQVSITATRQAGSSTEEPMEGMQDSDGDGEEIEASDS